MTKDQRNLPGSEDSEQGRGYQAGLPGIEASAPPRCSQDKAKGKRLDRPVKIFSKLFEEEIYIVESREEMKSLIEKGVPEPIYLRSEIHDLLSRDRESLKAVHMTKKVFPGSALA